MQELENQGLAAADSAHKKNGQKVDGSQSKRSVKFKENQVGELLTEWAIPNNTGITCAGLACVDMQLLSATCSGGEAIETFAGENQWAVAV